MLDIMVAVLSSLLTICIILSFSLPSDTQNINAFMEKHIVKEGAETNCNQTIKDRNIRFKNNCKFRNTFIHDTNGKKVKEMCAGIVKSTFVISKELLPLTDCLLMGRTARPPNCAYNQTRTTGVINITCENNYPVHFAGYKSSFCASYSPCALIVITVFLLSQLLLPAMR
ncbi:amphinase-4-like S homeolog isoform X1 [Xenopus laevis]|uniref:Amphinase-4-like S homeolog isoform X1 n=2 Tax=Xenopus laevis TaxID=8355 RepID=Q9W738_XENLA|nr:amphinase-4-like S homeolog precursor [Xenopus laevis]XP_041429649.1 amphinase-4-like S homeolog isoform X1 [Xenopus laevis]XP_041429655.1 amphinase-4-like S homeolog isoform X1 [Xenopus laevis]AAD41901.1 FRL2 protein [Xenopus laevis]OCT98078.1 hypothetical protein XELAEV_18010306mg [Xenopus laevis]prf//2201335B fibroblast growth factor receptor ligand [Xenopus laevis]